MPGLRLVQALYGYTAQDSDEITFKRGAKMRIIRPGAPGLDSSGGVKPPEFTKYLLLNHCDLEHGHIQHDATSSTVSTVYQLSTTFYSPLFSCHFSATFSYQTAPCSVPFPSQERFV